MIKRIISLVVIVTVAGGLLVIFTFDFIKIDWLSFMEVQPSYKPMEDPLPVPANSIPVEGAAYIPGMGAPVNPIFADDISYARGAQLFQINCVLCHGDEGKGDGVIGTFFEFKPADLTIPKVQNASDGSIFLIISNGVEGRMPALNENLNVRDRWDVVNFLRTLSQP
jgi:mono/diheme cytochrome c family protein